MSINRVMDKQDVVHNGILFSRRRNERMPFVVTWMNLKIDILGEVNQRKTNIR